MKLNPIIFGTSCLGNLYREIPMETKVSIAAEWFRASSRRSGSGRMDIRR